jgi:hypothetical protein
MKIFLVIIFSSIAVLAIGSAHAFDIPKECEEQAYYYLNSFKGAFESSSDSILRVSLGKPFKIGGMNYCNLIKLENGTDLLDIPENWSYWWTLFLDDRMHAAIHVDCNCKKAGLCEICLNFCRAVNRLLEHHPEFAEDDIYVLSLTGESGPRHVLLIIDLGDRKIVTSRDTGSYTILGLKKLYESEYSFANYSDVFPNLLKAAKEECEEQQYLE